MVHVLGTVSTGKSLTDINAVLAIGRKKLAGLNKITAVRYTLRPNFSLSKITFKKRSSSFLFEKNRPTVPM